jgi:hypothetical protein
MKWLLFGFLISACIILLHEGNNGRAEWDVQADWFWCVSHFILYMAESRMHGGPVKTSIWHQAGCVGYINSPPRMQLGRLSTLPPDAASATNASYEFLLIRKYSFQNFISVSNLLPVAMNKVKKLWHGLQWICWKEGLWCTGRARAGLQLYAHGSWYLCPRSYCCQWLHARYVILLALSLGSHFCFVSPLASGIFIQVFLLVTVKPI